MTLSIHTITMTICVQSLKGFYKWRTYKVMYVYNANFYVKLILWFYNIFSFCCIAQTKPSSDFTWVFILRDWFSYFYFIIRLRFYPYHTYIGDILMIIILKFWANDKTVRLQRWPENLVMLFTTHLSFDGPTRWTDFLSFDLRKAVIIKSFIHAK